MTDCSPLTRRPGGRDDSWTPTVAGMPKRDLLREVLSVFGQLFVSIILSCFLFFCVVRSKTLTKLALDWQDTLKKASSDDLL